MFDAFIAFSRVVNLQQLRIKSISQRRQVTYVSARNRHCETVRFQTHVYIFNPSNPELNPICYLLALLGAYHFLHVSRISVKLLTFRLLMPYIYIYIYIYIYVEHPFLMFLDHTHTHTHTVGLLWRMDRPVAETSTWQQITLTDSQEPGGIRTHHPSKRADTGIAQKTDFLNVFLYWWHDVAQLIEALRYKWEGRGFDFRWCHWNFSLT